MDCHYLTHFLHPLIEDCLGITDSETQTFPINFCFLISKFMVEYVTWDTNYKMRGHAYTNDNRVIWHTSEAHDLCVALANTPIDILPFCVAFCFCMP